MCKQVKKRGKPVQREENHQCSNQEQCTNSGRTTRGRCADGKLTTRTGANNADDKQTTRGRCANSVQTVHEWRDEQSCERSGNDNTKEECDCLRKKVYFWRKNGDEKEKKGKEKIRI